MRSAARPPCRSQGLWLGRTTGAGSMPGAVVLGGGERLERPAPVWPAGAWGGGERRRRRQKSERSGTRGEDQRAALPTRRGRGASALGDGEAGDPPHGRISGRGEAKPPRDPAEGQHLGAAAWEWEGKARGLVWAGFPRRLLGKVSGGSAGSPRPARGGPGLPRPCCDARPAGGRSGRRGR